MNLSYWEYNTWLSKVDFTIVGSGIVGLNCALSLREKFPKAKILILEKGQLPQGASTKNAGFACFGSLSEILDDLETHSEEEVFYLVKKRYEGLKLLISTLGEKEIDYQMLGGYELFLKSQQELYETCVSKIEDVNALLKPIFKDSTFKIYNNKFKFQNIVPNYVFSPFEGSIDTGKMMLSLLKLAIKKDILLLNSVEVKSFSELAKCVHVKTSNFEFKTNKLLIATNGFASQLLNVNVKPARAQVLITEPIENLHIKGTFHLDKGYYYFRNVNNRILFGGGRNLDFNAEETTEFGLTNLVQGKLETILDEVILPEKKVKVTQKWSGIMGVGDQKKAIVKEVSNHVFCGVRLGGMGVAIGSLIGKELADLVE